MNLTINSRSKQPIYDHFGLKKIGYVLGSTFTKQVNSSHLLQYPRGWACDIKSLETAEKLGAKKIVIINREANQKYSASITDFWQKSIFLERYGYGPQRCLELDYWVKKPISHRRKSSRGGQNGERNE